MRGGLKNTGVRGGATVVADGSIEAEEQAAYTGKGRRYAPFRTLGGTV